VDVVVVLVVVVCRAAGFVRARRATRV